jgi:hypothetical protein
MSHFLHPDNPTQMRVITYAKWCAFAKLKFTLTIMMHKVDIYRSITYL